MPLAECCTSPSNANGCPPDPMTSYAVSECYGAMTVKSSRMGANFLRCQLHFASVNDCSLTCRRSGFSLLTCNIYELKSTHHLLPSMFSLICKHSPHTSRIVWACLSTRSISCTPCQIWPICPNAAIKKPRRKSQWSDWSLSLTFEHTPRTQWIVGWTRNMWPQTSEPKENQQIWRVPCRKFWSGSGWSIASELAALVTSLWALTSLRMMCNPKKLGTPVGFTFVPATRLLCFETITWTDKERSTRACPCIDKTCLKASGTRSQIGTFWKPWQGHSKKTSGGTTMRFAIGHRIPDINYIWLNILRTNLCYGITEPNHNQMKLNELSHRCSLQLVVLSWCTGRSQSATTRRGPWSRVKPEASLQPAVMAKRILN